MVYGIVAEYNPFHNGHLYQIQTLRQRDTRAAIVVVMSGSFTQRGTPAILDKWQRAKLALLGGANLVLELPTCFVLQSAEGFATGAIRLLASLNIVDKLSFGVGNAPNILWQAATAIDNAETQKLLHQGMHQGLSYAQALSQALASLYSVDENALREPNTILGLEYLRALQKFAPHIIPLPLRRETALHNDRTLHEKMASASAIRKALEDKNPFTAIQNVVPKFTAEALKPMQITLPSLELLYRPLLVRLLTTSREELTTYANMGMGDGYEYAIFQAAKNTSTLTEFLACLQSRRYSLSRLRRAILCFLLGIKIKDIKKEGYVRPHYARLLGADTQGIRLLRAIKKNGQIPVLTKISSVLQEKTLQQNFMQLTPWQKMLTFDIRATNLWQWTLSNHGQAMKDYLTSPVILQR